MPFFIAAITLAGARFGPRVAGVLTGLPVVAGPIVLFLAIEQGAAFAAQSATATLAGEVSLAVFCVVYGWTALGAPWWVSVTLGWMGFSATTIALDRLPLGLAAASTMALAAPLVVSAGMPRTPFAAPTAGARDLSGGEVVLRMAAGMLLVLLLTAVARALGPRLSGLLTVFPIATTVLAVFSHRAQGAAFAVQLLRGLALGLYSLTAFFLTLALGLGSLGTPLGFLVASGAALAVQAGVLGVTARRTRGG